MRCSFHGYWRISLFECICLGAIDGVDCPCFEMDELWLVKDSTLFAHVITLAESQARTHIISMLLVS